MPIQRPRTSRSIRAVLRLALRAFMATSLVVLLGMAVVAERGCTEWIAHGIVDAPNAGRVIDASADPSPAELDSKGVTQQLGLDVGPPDASISLWIMDPPVILSPRATILVLHGIRDQKSSQIGFGRALAVAGFRAVLVDLRGHGRSSGEWLTYGIVESNDLKQVLDALASRQLLVGKLGVLGTSYGASIGIQLAAIDPRVSAIVAIAPFANVRELLPCYARQIGINWAISAAQMDAGFAKAGELAHVDLSAADPLTAIRATSAHVLLMHGRDDANIPCEHSQRLATAAGDRARLMLIDHEDHNTICADQSGVVHREMLGWFDQWLVTP